MLHLVLMQVMAHLLTKVDLSVLSQVLFLMAYPILSNITVLGQLLLQELLIQVFHPFVLSQVVSIV